MSSEPAIPPRPDGLHPVPPPPPAATSSDEQHPKATWSWLEGLGVYVLAFFVAGLATVPVFSVTDPDSDLGSIVASLIAALAIVGVLLVWLWRAHPRWPSIMRLPERGRWRRELSSGFLFGIGLYPVAIVVVGGIVLVLLQALTDGTVQAPEQVPQELSAIGLAITGVYAIAIAPVGEELFFRGVLFRALRDRYGFPVAAAGSGTAFGLIHYIPGPAVDAALLMIVMTFVGAAFAYLYERRATIVAPVAAHVTFNVIGLTLILTLR